MLDPAREERDLHIRAAGIFLMQLELLEIRRLRVLCHFGSAYSKRRTHFRNWLVRFGVPKRGCDAHDRPQRVQTLPFRSNRFLIQNVQSSRVDGLSVFMGIADGR